MTNKKSSTILEEELCQVKLQFGSNLILYQQAYRDHDKARKWLKKKNNQDKPKELVDKYILMLTQNKEYAKKYKKVMNIESLIRKRKKEEAEYEGHYERFLDSLPPRLTPERKKYTMNCIPTPEVRATQKIRKLPYFASRQMILYNTYGRVASTSYKTQDSREKIPSEHVIRK